MRTSDASRKRLVFLAVALAFVAGGCLITAAPQRKPAREQMTLDDTPVMVDYKPSATAADLGLPFYPGAQVQTSFSYTLTSKDGKPVTYYASAVFTTTDSAEVVGGHYSAKLPGKPRPAEITDEAGKRYVLAVGSKSEVRKVTITPQAKGCRIELVRASGVVRPVKPLRPRSRDQRVA